MYCLTTYSGVDVLLTTYLDVDVLLTMYLDVDALLMVYVYVGVGVDTLFNRIFRYMF